MKILFIVQGEGRGHLTQAITLENMLLNDGHEVVEILVGKSKFRRLPAFFTRNTCAPVRQFLSPNFLPSGTNKRACLSRSISYNMLKLPDYFKSMAFINRHIRESGADLVINFYELLTGLTYFFFRPPVPQVCIGHQYLFLHKDFQTPPANKIQLASLRLFTKLTALGASRRLALSFRPMNDDGKTTVVPPLLRKGLFRQKAQKGDFIHGYMVNSGYSEYIQKWHQQHPETPLHFFRDQWNQPSVIQIDHTLFFHQLNDTEFLQQMASCMAYACTGGFESVCEAMYLGKPVLMVPVHIEQDCNAFDAMTCGAGIIDKEFNLTRLIDFAKNYQPVPHFPEWVNAARNIILKELNQYACTDYVNQMYMVENFL